MTDIERNLELIINAIYGREVRQAIHDAIHDCYEDGKAGTIDLLSRELIKGEIANRETSDEALGKRIDAILALPEGSTTSDAELVDIRTGADGTTYSSAGAAVRAQIANILRNLVIISDEDEVPNDTRIKFSMFEQEIELATLEDILELQRGGYIADQQRIGEAVDAWLDEHPEATTSVLDGSITLAKLATEVIQKISEDNVPATRKINGKELSSDIALDSSDVHARPDTWLPTPSEIGVTPVALEEIPIDRVNGTIGDYFTIDARYLPLSEYSRAYKFGKVVHITIDTAAGGLGYGATKLGYAGTKVPIGSHGAGRLGRWGSPTDYPATTGVRVGSGADEGRRVLTAYTTIDGNGIWFSTTFIEDNDTIVR